MRPYGQLCDSTACNIKIDRGRPSLATRMSTVGVFACTTGYHIRSLRGKAKQQ